MRIADSLASAAGRIADERDGQIRHLIALADDMVASANRRDWDTYRRLAQEAILAAVKVEHMIVTLREVFGIFPVNNG